MYKLGDTRVSCNNQQVRIMGIAVTDVDADNDAQQLITAQLNRINGRLSLHGNGTLDADRAIPGGMDAFNA